MTWKIFALASVAVFIFGVAKGYPALMIIGSGMVLLAGSGGIANQIK